MKHEKLYADEGILSPAREAELLGKLSVVENENSALKDEVAELKQQLANLKKLVYGQKSEKTEVILENGEQLCMFKYVQ